MKNDEPSNVVNLYNINDDTLGEVLAYVFRMRLFFGKLLPLADEFSKRDYPMSDTSRELIISTRQWAERNLLETNSLIEKILK